MTCKACGSPDSWVVDSRKAHALRDLPERNRRRRECNGCGARWTTLEVHEDDWALHGSEGHGRAISDEAVAFAKECLTVLGARLRYYPPSAQDAAEILHRENPDVTAEDLHRALDVSKAWANTLYRRLHENGENAP